MSSNLYSIFLIGTIGFFTGFVGNSIGMISSFFIKDSGKRLKGVVLGVLGGLTLGLVCFDLLPEAFESGRITLVSAGFISGLIFAVLLDGKLGTEEKTTSAAAINNFLKIGIFMAIGIGIHNFPSGIALGSLLCHSPLSGIQLVIALIFDAIPEGLTLGVFFRECKIKSYKLPLISIITSIPLGIGSALGGMMQSQTLICFSLSLAVAMILYVTLRETLPAANDVWHGRLTTLGNILGLILGLLLISLIEKFL